MSGHQSPPNKPSDSESCRRILLVDDNRVVLEALGIYLNTLGFEVTQAMDGREGLSLFRSRIFDIVLSDVRMPGLDGLKLLKAIKSVNPRVPVVLISGYGDVDTVVEALKCGADNFLAKPVKMDSLSEVIEQSLSLACIQARPSDTLSSMQQSTSMRAESDPLLIRDMVYQIALSAVAVGFAQVDLANNLKLALAEAITNAMEHGNGWQKDKLVTVESRATRNSLTVTITDQGNGFDHTAAQDPTRESGLLEERGRGLFLMNSIMDKVIFEPPGNRVTLGMMRSAGQAE